MTDYEVFAIRHGEQPATKSHCYYRYQTYQVPDEDIEMHFFFWLVRNDTNAYLVDTGWSDPAVTKRQGGRKRLLDAREAVAALGTDPDDITHIVVTHMHYDHTGNLNEFPKAELILQAEEYEFWTSHYAEFPPQAVVKEDDEVNFIRAALQNRKVRLIEGEVEVLPGITAIKVGGHTPGQQIVTIDTQRQIVLASDALHFYEEMEKDRVYEVFSDLRQMYDAYADLRRRRDAGAVVVAGHDPRVMEQFEQVSTTLGDGLVVKLTR